MIIYLIRHGKTKGTEQHLYCGSTDLSLSENGVKELVGKKMGLEDNFHIAAQNGGFRYISSGMRRCNETLRLLFGEREFEVFPGLREINFGVFEMHSYEELKDREDYQNWLDADPEQTAPPQGESGKEMKNRVLETFSEIVKEGHDAVIVSHGGVIASIMEHLFADEEKNRYQWQPSPGGGYMLQIEEREYRYEPF